MKLLPLAKAQIKKLGRSYRTIFVKYLNKPTSLTALAIEINSACNRVCDWCPNSKTKRPKNMYMDENLFYSIIKQVREMRFKGKVTFNLYNEPLLDKRLIQFIKYVRENLPSSFIYLNTNGDLLNIDFWNQLRQAGLDYAKISQYNGKLNDNIIKILDTLDTEEKRRFDVSIFDLSKINNRAGAITSSSVLPLKKYCDRPFSQLSVNYEGKVILCCNDYYGRIEIGDIRTASIKEIWQSEILMRYRRELLTGNRAGLDLCKTCDM